MADRAPGRGPRYLYDLVGSHAWPGKRDARRHSVGHGHCFLFSLLADDHFQYQRQAAESGLDCLAGAADRGFDRRIVVRHFVSLSTLSVGLQEESGTKSFGIVEELWHY